MWYPFVFMQIPFLDAGRIQISKPIHMRISSSSECDAGLVPKCVNTWLFSCILYWLFSCLTSWRCSETWLYNREIHFRHWFSEKQNKKKNIPWILKLNLWATFTFKWHYIHHGLMRYQYLKAQGTTELTSLIAWFGQTLPLLGQDMTNHQR